MGINWSGVTFREDKKKVDKGDRACFVKDVQVVDQWLLERLAVYQVGNHYEWQDDHGHDLQGQILVRYLRDKDKDHASYDEHEWVEKASTLIFAKALEDCTIFFIEVFVFPLGKLETIEDKHEDWEDDDCTTKDYGW